MNLPDPAKLERWSEAAGALLGGCENASSAELDLKQFLLSRIDSAQLNDRQAIDESTSLALKSLLPIADTEIDFALAVGAAWLDGRRSRGESRPQLWEPVVSGRDLDAQEFPRLTGETLIGLIGRASREVLIVTGYLDPLGAKSLLPSLKAASNRGASIEIGALSDLVRDDALDLLENELHGDGVRFARLNRDAGFPHLKVLVIDSRQAYLGSANFTHPGMSDNVELGALVEGPGVEVVRHFVQLQLNDVKERVTSK